MPNTTPLTDAINALTTYANETTGASDTTLSDAVETLVDGYGGGGGTSIGVETTTIPNILNMFYALEHGTAVTNTFTLTQAIPNTETEIFDTGLSTVHGIFIADEDCGLNTGSTPENVLFAIAFNPTTEGSADYAFTRYSTNISYGTNTNGVIRGFLARCTWRVDSGKLYCTGAFNRNDSYTPFHSGHTYRWVAW